ncbi:MAG: iron ABC transporter permease [Deltaproteobacteria bacterium]|nr:MAG: iron ABC transporter permease [Deltaproteobacteria bacterium]
MNLHQPPLLRRLVSISVLLTLLLLVSAVLGLGLGSAPPQLVESLGVLFGQADPQSMTATIIWRLRLPRVLLAALVGATLSLGGLVFQALLRNPLAEPYILGVSGGSAVGAILGILLGLAPFPGVALLAFVGSMATLLLVLILAAGRAASQKGSLLLAGVMVNAFCSAVIMFFISITQDARLHNIIYWLMGDLSQASPDRLALLLYLLPPCIVLIFLLARPLNLLALGEEVAMYMGINVKTVSYMLLVITSLMVSAIVCQSGLVGFVGLVIPHLLRLLLGPDHRLLIPACVLGGGSYLVLCDLLSRLLPSQGEMPVGVITAIIGAPLFILLLQRGRG